MSLEGDGGLKPEAAILRGPAPRNYRSLADEAFAKEGSDFYANRHRLIARPSQGAGTVHVHTVYVNNGHTSRQRETPLRRARIQGVVDLQEGPTHFTQRPTPSDFLDKLPRHHEVTEIVATETDPKPGDSRRPLASGMQTRPQGLYGKPESVPSTGPQIV
jgi:hypothetical protein